MCLTPASAWNFELEFELGVDNTSLIPNHHKLSLGPAEAQLHSDWSMEPGTRVMPGSSTNKFEVEI